MNMINSAVKKKLITTPFNFTFFKFVKISWHFTARLMAMSKNKGLPKVDQERSSESWWQLNNLQLRK